MTQQQLLELIELASKAKEIADQGSGGYYHDLKVFNIEEIDDYAIATDPTVVLNLCKMVQEMREILEFYSNGGNPNRDIWEDKKLGYFTGKRAREALARIGGLG